MFRVGVMSYALSAVVKGEPNWERLLSAAATMKVDGIEFYHSHWGATEQDVENADAVKRRAAGLGLELYGIGSGARLGFADDRSRDELETLKTQIRAAAAVGAPIVTFPAIDRVSQSSAGDSSNNGFDFASGAGPLIDQVTELADFAATYRVQLALLNHGSFVCSSWEQEWVLKLAKVNNVGICLDPGNYLYYRGEDPQAATQRLATSVCMVRLGDWTQRTDDKVRAEFNRGKPLRPYQATAFGTGEVDHVACFRLLATANYKGFLSLKNAGPNPTGPLAALHHSLGGIHSMINRL